MKPPEPDMESPTWPFVLSFAKGMESRMARFSDADTLNEREVWKHLRNAVEHLKMDLMEFSTVQNLQARCELVACAALALHRKLESR